MRSDNDTWDITSGVGSTALFVAAARALEAQRPQPLAVDEYAAVFCRAAGGQWADLVDGGAPDHQLRSPFGAHFVAFQAARTRYFDEYFSAAAAAGIGQIVIVAAGLDSRAFRLSWPHGTVVYELDQPRVLDFKRKVLRGAGATPTAERREVATDLRADWAAALRGSGYDPARPSAWLAEGLLIYLPAAAQAALFAGIDALAAPGSRAAVEESAPMSADEFEARRTEELAAGAQDSFFTLVYNEQHAPAVEWFRAHGWPATGTPLSELLQSVGRPSTAADTDADTLLRTISLVTALKR